MLRPYLTFIYLPLGIGLAVALWFSGAHHGTTTANESCNAERLAVADATDAELAIREHQMQRAAKQITDANDARDLARAALARLAAIDHPGLVCHAAPSSGGDPLPGAAGAPGPGASGGGELSKEFSYDPWPEARRADAIVEGCRDLFNRFPVPQPAPP